MIKVTANFELTKEKEQAYIEAVKEKIGKEFDNVESIDLHLEDEKHDHVEVKINFKEKTHFERVRRIK